MEWLADVLKIRPGEGRIVALLTGMILVISAGVGMGAASVNALFFSRFGVEYLPHLYIALGFVTFINLMAVAGLLGRFPREQVYTTLPLVLIVVLVVSRLTLALNLRWFYPVLFIGKEVIISLQTVLIWGLAGEFFEARQAKRLFPLFVAGSIAGISLGSIATPLLVRAVGSENILLVWAFTLAAGYALIRRMPGYERVRARGAKSAPPQKTRRPGGSGEYSFVEEIRRGYQYVRQSRLMRWFALSSVFFSVLWFSLLLPFSRLAAAQYPDADALASFLGVFQGVQNGIALLVALLLTNRLFVRFGLLNMLLVFPAIYLGGFAWLLAFASFPAIVAFRLVKLVWGQAIAETAWQATFNVVPSERRSQTYTFFNAVPGQAGVVLSGVILVIGEKALPPQQLYWIGLVAAVACLATVWQARRAYTQALVDALRLGQAHVFFSEEEPFGGVQRDASALPVILGGLADPHPGVRRLSAEILEQLGMPQSVDALLKAVGDTDGEVRAAALRALAATDAAAVVQPALASLDDPLPEVRCQAVQALLHSETPQTGVLEKVRRLRHDPQPAVQARAAVAIALAGDPASATAILSSLMADPAPEARALAVRAAGECWGLEIAERALFLPVISAGLADQSALVRGATAAALAYPPVELVEVLVRNLGDEDSAARQEAAAALGRAGKVALQAVLDALNDSHLKPGALLALENLSMTPPADTLRAVASQEAALALRYHRLASGLAVHGETSAHEPTHLLLEGLKDKARGHALNALHAIGLFTDRRTALLSIENLGSAERDQRAYALETLETLGEPQLVRPLLSIWESGEASTGQRDGLVTEVLQDPDAWLRACGVMYASASRDEGSLSLLARLSQADPDPLVRETASQALQGGNGVDTLKTITTMERVLFLRRVKLFANLTPVDLVHIAAIAQERLFPDGEVIAQEGDSGDEMYIIVSGEVSVINESGHEMACRKPGDYVGEMAIISQQPRMATLVAAGDVRTLSISRKPFEEILRGRFEISLAVMRELCERLRQSSAIEMLSKS
jgi:HEAT repeat protein